MHFAKHPFFGCRIPKYAKLMCVEPLTYFEPLMYFEPPRVKSVAVQQYNF